HPTLFVFRTIVRPADVRALIALRLSRSRRDVEVANARLHEKRQQRVDESRFARSVLSDEQRRFAVEAEPKNVLIECAPVAKLERLKAIPADAWSLDARARLSWRRHRLSAASRRRACVRDLRAHHAGARGPPPAAAP